jgi:hypothetical protein
MKGRARNKVAYSALFSTSIRKFLTPALVVALGVAAMLTGDPSSLARAQIEPVKCIKRKAELTPPREALPSLRAFRGREQEIAKAAKLKAVCAEGEVPMVAPQRRPHFPKGNPLIGNYISTGAVPFTGELDRRNMLLPFDQVYWKRDSKEPARTKSMNGSGDPPCNGVMTDGTCYYYANAGEQRVDGGGGMTYTIEDPTVDNSGDEGGHSIDELAVQGGPSNGDDVEMGWSVSPDQWGDTKPHLFVYHWINWNQTCYNTCAWNQVSSTYYPGMDLTPLVGQNLYIGWVHYNNAWWGWFNDQWLGYIKDAEWSGAFTQSTLIQWYGEVATNNGVPPKTQMGNGEFPSNPTAASMATLCDVDVKAWVCFYRDQQSAGATDVNYYDILNHTSFGAVRYGGPGQ